MVGTAYSIQAQATAIVLPSADLATFFAALTSPGQPKNICFDARRFFSPKVEQSAKVAAEPPGLDNRSLRRVTQSLLGSNI